MSSLKYLIEFGNKKSGATPLGQKDAFYLADAALAYGQISYSHAGDTTGRLVMDTSYFSIHLPVHDSGSDTNKEMTQDLYSYLQDLTTKSAKADTIKVFEIVVKGHSDSYQLNKEVEHPEALIGVHGSEDNFIIRSDKAILSIIPMDGDKPTERIQLDFKNQTVNGKEG